MESIFDDAIERWYEIIKVGIADGSKTNNTRTCSFISFFLSFFFLSGSNNIGNYIFHENKTMRRQRMRRNMELNCHYRSIKVSLRLL